MRFGPGRRKVWELLASAGILFLTVIAAELLTRTVLPLPSNWDPRLLLYSEGGVIRNKPWGGYGYEPHKTMQFQLAYLPDPKNPRLEPEYLYRITTNSYGLVQLKDPVPGKPAILLLGDSLTEGQGASPWFYDVEKRWPAGSQYQLLNGGLFGTGFQHWTPIYRHVAATLSVRKVVIIFIAQDWLRPTQPLPDETIRCLQSSHNCDGSTVFYGMPDDPVAAAAELERVARSRAAYVAKLDREQRLIERLALFRNLLQPGYRWLRGTIRGDEPSAVNFAASKQALLGLAADIGRNNLVLLHLPQKEEVEAGPNALGLKGREVVRQAGLKLVDGFAWCGMTPADFHLRDGHPNADGHGKIGLCVERVIADAWPSAAVQGDATRGVSQ
jgi:hypothetical protein